MNMVSKRIKTNPKNKTDPSDFFGWIFFPLKVPEFFKKEEQKKGKKNYLAPHTRLQRTKKKTQRNVSLFNWKAYATILVLIKEKIFNRKSHLDQSYTKPFNFVNNSEYVIMFYSAHIEVNCLGFSVRMLYFSQTYYSFSLSYSPADFHVCTCTAVTEQMDFIGTLWTC